MEDKALLAGLAQDFLQPGGLSAGKLTRALARLERRNIRVSVDELRAHAAQLYAPLGLRIVRVRNDRRGGEPWFIVLSSELSPAGVPRWPAGVTSAFWKALDVVFANDRCEGATFDELAAATSSPQAVRALITAGLLDEVSSCKGSYGISTWTLHSMEKALAARYSTLRPCEYCGKPLLEGVLCENPGCGGRVHAYCRGDVCSCGRPFPRASRSQPAELSRPSTTQSSSDTVGSSRPTSAAPGAAKLEKS